MDLLTLAQAKKYTDSQRIGYEEIKSIVVDKTQYIEVPFNSPIGLHVIDFTPGRLMLTTPNSKPNISQIDEAGNNICASDLVFVGYHTYNGLLDNPALFVACPSLGGYDFLQGWAFVYAFETTSDTMGMGLTITKGWYAINSNTFDIVPIDLATNPVSILPVMIEDGIRPGCEEYMSDLFPLMERYEYVVTENNLRDFGGGNYFVTLANLGAGKGHDLLPLVTPGFQFNNSLVSSPFATTIFTISWPEIHKIEPKFLPGICLPLVELTTEVTVNGVELTTDEITKLDEVADMGLPIVAKMALLTDEGPKPMTLVMSNLNASFITSLPNGTSVQITKPTGSKIWNVWITEPV